MKMPLFKQNASFLMNVNVSDLNITKKQLLTVEDFNKFFELFNPSTLKLSENKRSWRVSIEEINRRNYDLKAVNPNRKDKEDTRAPQELLSIIESYTDEVKNIITSLKSKV